MHWIARDRLERDVLCGTFLNLGSAASVEITASLGFDWLLIDLEHGCGTAADLRSQLIAAATCRIPTIVRVPSADPDAVQFALDSGAAGIMFPYINTALEAEQAVQIASYPPRGSRGVAGNIRATNFGSNWTNYFQSANQQLVVLIQIETPQAVEQSEQIAAVDGVDVLFVGPLDLSVNLQCPGDFSHPKFLDALAQVVQSGRQHQKAVGILSRPELVTQHFRMGFKFMALGSDIGAVQNGMANNLKLMKQAAQS